MRNVPSTNLARPSSWAAIASLPASNASDHKPTNVVPAPNFSLPTVSLKQPVLTFSAAKNIISNPSNATTTELAAARALLTDIGPPRPLSPQTGLVVQKTPSAIAIGIAPTSDPQVAFTSFKATQKALIAAATLANQPLPPHVVVPGIGKWAYIYCLEADFARLVSILAHLRCIFEDLEINSTPLPTVVQTLRDSAAAGVAKRLANKKTTLVRSSTPTTVPARTRLALSSALSCHINSIKELRSATQPSPAYHLLQRIRNCTPLPLQHAPRGYVMYREPLVPLLSDMRFRH